MLGDLIIQPVGGVTGGGALGGPLHSEGRLPLASLSSADRAQIERLFSKPAPKRPNFYYRITLKGPDETKTIEVPPEMVPKPLIDSIHDTLD